MSNQSDIFGNTTNTTPISKDVEDLFHKLPAIGSSEQREWFVKRFLNKRLPWLEKSARKEEIYKAGHELLSADRAIRKIRKKDDEAKI